MIVIGIGKYVNAMELKQIGGEDRYFPVKDFNELATTEYAQKLTLDICERSNIHFLTSLILFFFLTENNGKNWKLEEL